MLQVACFTFNAFAENTYLVYNSEGLALIVDPGCYSKEEEQTLFNFIEKHNLKVLGVYNTHAHIDHVLGVAACQRKFSVDFYLHPNDASTLKAGEVVAEMYGFNAYQVVEEFKLLPEIIILGEDQLTVLFTPGHSAGHTVFYSENAGKPILIAGDVLFKGSIGRTDLPGGNFETLSNSIKNQVYPLPKETIVYPGHGDTTTIGFERIYNPFVKA